MRESQQLVLGLSFFGLLILLLVCYLVWNLKLRTNKKGLTRMANEDAAVITDDPTKMDHLKTSTIPALISANSGLAGITFAALIIVIALIIVEVGRFEGLRKAILYMVLGLSSLATVCWLFCLDQLIKIVTPSIKLAKVLKFYQYSMNLWLLGMVFVVCALNLFLLLANPYLAMGTGLATFTIVIVYWRIWHDW